MSNYQVQRRKQQDILKYGFGVSTAYRTVEFAYSPDLTTEAAYNLIKTLPEFEGAEDI